MVTFPMAPIYHKKCCICGKRILGGYNHTEYCPTCSRFAIRMAAKKLPGKTVESIWGYVRQYGYVCYYTGMPLDMTDPHSPWYCVFEHWLPHDTRKVVLTSSLVNEMKADLTEKEFWSIIRQLANYKRRHTKVRKKRLLYWKGDHIVEEKTDFCRRASGQFKAGTIPKKCDVCGKPVFISNAKYCSVCAKFVARLHSRKLPLMTIKDTLNYIRKNGYQCYYTGMPLDVNDASSPWYCVFDHWIPQDPGKIVLTFALLNVMKSDLSEKEFWYYVFGLADYKEKHKKVRKRKLVYWVRLVPLFKLTSRIKYFSFDAN